MLCSSKPSRESEVEDKNLHSSSKQVQENMASDSNEVCYSAVAPHPTAYLRQVMQSENFIGSGARNGDESELEIAANSGTKVEDEGALQEAIRKAFKDEFVERQCEIDQSIDKVNKQFDLLAAREKEVTGKTKAFTTSYEECLLTMAKSQMSEDMLTLNRAELAKERKQLEMDRHNHAKAEAELVTKSRETDEKASRLIEQDSRQLEAGVLLESRQRELDELESNLREMHEKREQELNDAFDVKRQELEAAFMKRGRDAINAQSSREKQVAIGENQLHFKQQEFAKDRADLDEEMLKSATEKIDVQKRQDAVKRQEDELKVKVRAKLHEIHKRSADLDEREDTLDAQQKLLDEGKAALATDGQEVQTREEQLRETTKAHENRVMINDTKREELNERARELDLLDKHLSDKEKQLDSWESKGHAWEDRLVTSGPTHERMQPRPYDSRQYASDGPLNREERLRRKGDRLGAEIQLSRYYRHELADEYDQRHAKLNLRAAELKRLKEEVENARRSLQAESDEKVQKAKEDFQAKLKAAVSGCNRKLALEKKHLQEEFEARCKVLGGYRGAVLDPSSPWSRRQIRYEEDSEE